MVCGEFARVRRLRLTVLLGSMGPRHAIIHLPRHKLMRKKLCTTMLLNILAQPTPLYAQSPVWQEAGASNIYYLATKYTALRCPEARLAGGWGLMSTLTIKINTPN